MVVTLKNQMQSHPYRISNSCICNVKGKKEKSSATGHLRPIKKKAVNQLQKTIKLVQYLNIPYHHWIFHPKHAVPLPLHWQRA